MFITLKRVLCTAPLAAALLLMPTTARAGEVEDLRKELNEMRAEMAKMKAELADYKDMAGKMGAPAAGAAKDAGLKTPKGMMIKPYGFINAQYIYDSNRTSDGRQAMWVLRDVGFRPAGGPLPARAGTNSNAETNIHARLTRLGLDIDGGQTDYLWNAKLSAKVELDFFGAGDTESRNHMRMRHAYVKAAWDNGLSFLAGQTSDIVSPLFPNSEPNVIQWNGGNPGDRRPQFRLDFSKTFDKVELQLTGGVLRTEAVGGQDADGNGVNDGMDASTPMFQGRVGLKFPGWVEEKKIAVGVSGSVAREDTAVSIPAPPTAGGDKTFRSDLLNVDLVLPIWKGILTKDDYLFVQGEWWQGRNLNDLRGGIGQGINATAGTLSVGDEIQAQGGWIEANYKYNKVWNIAGGYGVDNPDDQDLPFGAAPSAAILSGSRRENQVWYLTNNFDLGGGYMVSFRYLNMRTAYFDTESNDDRLIFMVQWNF